MRLSLLYLTTSAVILSTVAACSPPEKGVVMSTKYNRAHYEETIYCAMYDKHMMCKLWLPRQDWVPDEWSLKLKDGKDTGWRKVPKSVYDGPCGQLDAIYPGCMS